jgi:predicted DNA-binding transcriptional regulator YafY
MDIKRLRELGYAIDSVRGPAGGYRLGDHGLLPPLLWSDDEAVAVAVGVGVVKAVPGIEETSTLALAKLEQIPPDPLRRRIRALHDNTDIGPANTWTNIETPPVDPALLADLAAAVRDHEAIRFFFYGDEQSRVEAEPHRLVSWQQHWYDVARRRPADEWQAYRADWITLRVPGGGRFTRRPLDRGDYAAFVLRGVAPTGWKVQARIAVDAAPEDVLSRINATVGVVETVDESHCVLVTGADALETVAVWIGMLDLDFCVTSRLSWWSICGCW